jgi:hypothetical protein
MPIKKYDKYFGGKGGAAKAKKAMEKTYPSKEKAEQVFYALKNKRKAQSGK